MIFDIEVEVTNGFPDINKAENKITAIGFNDSLLDKYYCYVLDETGKLNDDFDDDVIVESFSNEYDLLHQFFIKYKEIQPTILTGWNVEFFDITYLYNRAQQIVGQTIANFLSPVGIVHWSEFVKRNSGSKCFRLFSII